MKNQELVLQFMPLAEKIAKYYFKKTPPQVQLDELISAAYMGLVDAAKRYDESKNFNNFVKWRIIGEIKDYLRSLMWGRHNEKVKSIPENFDIAEEREVGNFDEVIEDIGGKRISSVAKNILKMYYGQNMSLAEIGNKFNLTGARVSQLLKETLGTLKNAG